MAILHDWARGDNEPSAEEPNEAEQAEAAHAEWEMAELEAQARNWLLSQDDDDRSTP